MIWYPFYSGTKAPPILVPACANPLLEIIENFGKLLEENWAHGFCLERCFHEDTGVRINKSRTCGPPPQGE
jgi:hypothetical protein